MRRKMHVLCGALVMKALLVRRIVTAMPLQIAFALGTNGERPPEKRAVGVVGAGVALWLRDIPKSERGGTCCERAEPKGEPVCESCSGVRQKSLDSA